MNNKPRPFRPGDLVTIPSGVVVTRVGYDAHHAAALQDAKNLDHYQRAVNNLLVCVREHEEAHTRYDGKDRIEQALAYAITSARLTKGDQQRKLFTEINTQMQVLTVWEVVGKSSCRTGRYFPPWGGSSRWGEEDDYEAGGLSDMKQHLLLHVLPADGVYRWRPGRLALSAKQVRADGGFVVLATDAVLAVDTPTLRLNL